MSKCCTVSGAISPEDYFILQKRLNDISEKKTISTLIGQLVQTVLLLSENEFALLLQMKSADLSAFIVKAIQCSADYDADMHQGNGCDDE